MDSHTVIFPGVAPVPSGAKVRLLVDDLLAPKKAWIIEDLLSGRMIRYATDDPPKLKAGPKGGYVRATVVSVFVYSGGSTELTLKDMGPDRPA